MMCRLQNLTILVMLLALPTSLLAEDPVNLDELLNQVRSAQSEHKQLDAEREARFLRDKQNQQANLDKARAALAAAQRKSAALKGSYEANQTQMAKLKKEIEENAGELNQLAAVLRQFATDIHTSAQGSMLSGQFPERLETLERVATARRVPDINELESLWLMLQQELTEGGKVARFQGDFVKPDGSRKTAEIIRVGQFNAVVASKDGGGYLNYTPGVGFVELARQPGSDATGLIDEFAAARSGVAPLMIDPTRGSLLAVLIESPSLLERIRQGGTVGYVIIGLAAAGLLLAIAQGGYLLWVGTLFSAQMKNLAQPNVNNPLGRVLRVYEPTRNEDVETLELRLSEAILKEVPALERGQPILKLLAAVAPLLGLLGTVTGMILTFQAITQYGTGDPKLMAGGISQALVTTVLGLVAAIPLLFFNSLLASRSRSLVQVLDEQSAGLLARRVEQDRGLG